MNYEKRKSLQLLTGLPHRFFPCQTSELPAVRFLAMTSVGFLITILLGEFADKEGIIGTVYGAIIIKVGC